MRAFSPFFITLWAFVCAVLMGNPAHANSEPALKIEASMHTAGLRQIAVDASVKWAVTVSDDKTARIWNVQTHALVAVLRVPIGQAKLVSL
jgi:WD40 repeat protein